MNIELREITEENKKECFALKVAAEQAQYIATKETNTNALAIYRKAGFRDTGEMNDEEVVLKLDF